MKKTKKGVSLIMLAAAMLLSGAPGVRAQEAGATGTTIRLYVDPATHAVYTQPGKHRRLLAEIPVSMLNGSAQQRTAAQLRHNQEQLSTLSEQNAQLESSNGELKRQLAEIRPAWQTYIENFQNKFRVGTLVYGDYRLYTHTGFQPQELTQLTNPGPGNNLYNSFDLTRSYLNFYFFPTKDWTLRVTPNLYKTIGSSNVKVGSSTGFGSNLDGDLGVRIKYANLRYNDLWDNVPMLKGGTAAIGQQANPLVGWEEDLYGFRYVNLTPWNYLSLSSTQLGLSMQGPVHLFGSEKTYFEYNFGVYNNASFHAFEQTNTKEVMARLTAYPFGANWRFQGLGLTGFYNYGYGNTTPDSAQIPTALKGGDAHITRVAALLHYTAEQWGLAGEFDYGNNAFSAANLFSGSGPADAFGFATGPALTKPAPWNSACSAAKPCYSLFDTFGPQTAAWEAILNNGQAREEGFDLFGHYHIPHTRLTAFGMYQWFMPNDKFPTDPLDFQRFVVGLSYQVNEFLRFALDSQNVIFYHDQQSVPVSTLARYGYTPGGSFNGRLLPATGSIPFLVPRDTHSFFLNMEFNY